MGDDNIIAVVDVGTTKIVVLVGEMDAKGGVYVIGHGESPAEGLRRGVVVDMEKTVRSIRSAVKDAQLISGTEVDRVTVGIAGEHVRSLNSHGVIAVSRADREITDNDVRRAIDAAGAVSIPVDREIIHVIPQSFSVDDQTGVKDPQGMSGVRLEVEVHIVTASVATAKNLHRALERCDLETEHIVLESLALSSVLLTDAQLEAGATIVDIGGDITNVSVFYDGTVRHTLTVPLGGRNVTSDIAIGLRASLETAESLKLGQGAALAAMVDPEETIEVRGAGRRDAKGISRHVLASIIEPRMEEILSLVEREIRRAGVADLATGAMVLTGGGSLLPGTAELAEQIFDLPVRTGGIAGIQSIPDELSSNRYTTAHGLLLYAFHNEPAKGTRVGGVRKFLKKFENWISRQF